MCLAPYIVPSLGLPIAAPNYRGRVSDTRAVLFVRHVQIWYNFGIIQNTCATFFLFCTKNAQIIDGQGNQGGD